MIFPNFSAARSNLLKYSTPFDPSFRVSWTRTWIIRCSRQMSFSLIIGTAMPRPPSESSLSSAGWAYSEPFVTFSLCELRCRYKISNNCYRISAKCVYVLDYLVLTKTCMHFHHLLQLLKIMAFEEDSCVRTRWRIEGQTLLSTGNRQWFDGTALFRVGKDGKITRIEVMRGGIPERKWDLRP